MRIKSIMLTLMLLGAVFVSGCFGPPSPQQPPPPYKPEIDLKISPDTLPNTPIELNDNQTELIKLTVTKLDDKNISTYFVLKFKPSNPQYLESIEAESDTKLEEKTTETLTQKGREFPYQFRVRGRKVLGQTESRWTLDIEVFYNNSTFLKRKTLDILVK